MKKTFIILIFSFFIVYNFFSYISLKAKIDDFRNLEKKLVILEDYMSSDEANIEYNQILRKYESYFVSLAYISPAHEKYNEGIIKSKMNDISIILKENEFFISKIEKQLVITTILLLSYITFSIIIFIRKKLKIT